MKYQRHLKDQIQNEAPSPRGVIEGKRVPIYLGRGRWKHSWILLRSVFFGPVPGSSGDDCEGRCCNRSTCRYYVSLARARLRTRSRRATVYSYIARSLLGLLHVAPLVLEIDACALCIKDLPTLLSAKGRTYINAGSTCVSGSAFIGSMKMVQRVDQKKCCHSQDHCPLSDAVLCHQPAELGGLQGRELLSLPPVRALAGLCRHPHSVTAYSANMGRSHMDQ